MMLLNNLDSIFNLLFMMMFCVLRYVSWLVCSTLVSLGRSHCEEVREEVILITYNLLNISCIFFFVKVDFGRCVLWSIATAIEELDYTWYLGCGRWSVISAHAHSDTVLKIVEVWHMMKDFCFRIINHPQAIDVDRSSNWIIWTVNFNRMKWIEF